MNERLINLLGGIAALLLVIMLLVPRTGLQEEIVSWPTSIDHGKDGLAGMATWLKQAAVPTMSLRHRYDRLTAGDQGSQTGNLLIISLPQALPSRYRERLELRYWLAQGNNLLILAAINDEPEWSGVSSGGFAASSDFLNDLGFSLEAEDCGCPEADEEDNEQEENKDKPVATQPESQPQQEDEERLLISNHAHPLVTEVDQVACRMEPGLNQYYDYQLTGNGKPRSSLILMQDKENQIPALWQFRVGQGTVWLSRYADLFGNVSLGKEDNARLFDNMVNLGLGPGGVVIFDDMHQGLSKLYDPAAFFRDPRLHHTAGFILAFWLVYLLGQSSRFFPLPGKDNRHGLIEHVQAVGGLFARRLQTYAVAQRLLFHFNNEMRSIYKLPQNGEPVWEKLATNARINSTMLAELRTIDEQIKRHNQVNLKKLMNHLEKIRKDLL